MKTITSQDKGKRFFLDNKREAEVELVDPLEDIEGLVKVKIDGNVLNVELHRLTEIEELPIMVLTDRELLELDYPQKVSKLTIEVYDAENGESYTQWIEGKDAEKWCLWMRELCYRAEKLGANPKWLSLNWSKKEKSKGS